MSKNENIKYVHFLLSYTIQPLECLLSLFFKLCYFPTEGLRGRRGLAQTMVVIKGIKASSPETELCNILYISRKLSKI